MEALTNIVIRMSMCVFPQILVIIGLTHALVVFRVIAAVLFAEGQWEFLSDHSMSGAMMLGAVLHYLIITVMTRVHELLNVCLFFLLVMNSVSLTMSLSLQINRIVAMKLCEIGMFARCILVPNFKFMLFHQADLNIIFHVHVVHYKWTTFCCRIQTVNSGMISENGNPVLDSCKELVSSLL